MAMGFLKSDKPVIIKDHSLWIFSVELYANEANRQALLFLQEQYQLNINVILAMLWLAKTGRGICETSCLESLLKAVNPWQQLITEALRDLRKHIDKKNTELYQSVLDIEIFSEKIQQCVIHDFFSNTKKSVVNSDKKAKDAIHNLQTYLTLAKARPSDSGYQHIRHLLSDTFSAFKAFDFPQTTFDF